ncbi:MAG: twin transmembrane helix small protein [Alphaproteobacteria bacterium]
MGARPGGDYMWGMDTLAAVFPYLIGLGLASVLIVLLTGIVSMLRGGEFNRRYGNKLMRLRVATQGVTILLFAIFMLFIKH